MFLIHGKTRGSQATLRKLLGGGHNSEGELWSNMVNGFFLARFSIVAQLLHCFLETLVRTKSEEKFLEFDTNDMRDCT